MSELAKRGEKWARRNGRSPYDVMNDTDIYNLPVADLADKDCVLFLWATYPKLAEALKTIEAWGFKYKTVAFTWIKLWPRWESIFAKWFLVLPLMEVLEKIFCFGLGYWTRGNPEICLLATKGHPKRLDNHVANLTIAARGEHSRKPDEIRDKIVALVGDLPRIELFARQVTLGWDCLGFDIDGLDIRESIKNNESLYPAGETRE